MARIANEELERLKQEVSVQRLIESRGVKLTRHGKDLIGLCPLHSDTNPSLVVTPSKNLWHCLGACQTGGTSIDWVMKAHRVEFRHAIELLRADLPTLEASSPSRAVKASTVRILPPPIERDADDSAVLQQVVAFYHEQLKLSPEALGYLAKRGLDSPEMIERFQLGFANRTLGYRLPEKSRKTGEELRGQLQRLGLLRESGHEHLNGSLVVPLFDQGGNVVQLYGRKIGERLRPGTPLHLYLPGPHRGVFNVEALTASPEIILCEALLDALTFWRHGLRNVTSSYGVNGFTDEHLETFKRHGTERVLIAYDRDDAGDKAAATLAEKLQAAGIASFRVEFPHGMDANEYALKVTPAPRSLELVLRKASWLGNGKKPHRPELVEGEISSARVRALDLDLSLAAKEEKASDPSPAPASLPNLAKDAEVPVIKTTPATVVETSIAAVMPLAAPPFEVAGDEVRVTFGTRLYRVRGVPKTPSAEHLPLVVLLEHVGDVEHVSFADRLDLFLAKSRDGYAKQAELDLGFDAAQVRRDLGMLLGRLEQYQQEEQERAHATAAKEPEMSEDERREALDLLQDPKLLDRILQDFERCGVVGEETNKLMGYLATVSRKLDDPLAVIIQSSSAAGKSALMEAMLAFVPPEDREKFSAMTGQALFYAEDLNLKHKILAIVEEEGAERATYALKLLQSEKELTIASTGKDPKTGQLSSRTYHVEGPVMILVTTTAVDVDEELLNRCIVLTVDEDREQTRAIHRLQRRSLTLQGQRRDAERENVLRVHRNAQRLLRPLRVVVAEAEALTFPDTCTRTRRDHRKYLSLIQAIAFLKQRQREILHDEQGDFDYIEATLDDIAIANGIAHEVLGRSLDELAPQTRKLLLKLDDLVAELAKASRRKRDQIRFSRRQVREATGWHLTPVKIHLDRLVDYEYVVVHRGGRGQSFEYELVYDGEGKDGSPFLAGLLDVNDLGRSRGYDANLSGSRANLSGPDPAQITPRSGSDPIAAVATSPHRDSEIVAAPSESREDADPGHRAPASYRTATPHVHRKVS